MSREVIFIALSKAVTVDSAPSVFADSNFPKVVNPMPEMLLSGYSVVIFHWACANAGDGSPVKASAIAHATVRANRPGTN